MMEVDDPAAAAAQETSSKRSAKGQLTVQQLENDEISQMAADNWKADPAKPFNPQVSLSNI